MSPLVWAALLLAALAWPLVVICREEISDEDFDRRWSDVEGLFE